MTLKVTRRLNSACAGPCIPFVAAFEASVAQNQALRPASANVSHAIPTWRTALARLLLALVWTSIASVAYGEDVFVKDAATGCAVFKPNLKAGEAITWQGACAQGYGSGPGIAKWTAADGSSVTFEGNFAAGKLQGEGRMTASGGDRYVGAYKDGRRQGYGTYVSSNRDRYEGQYKDNQRHGHGILTLASGQRLEGEWANGAQVASKALAPTAAATTRPALAGATSPVAQAAPQPRVDAVTQAQTPSQLGTEPPPPPAAPPALTPGQQAQQQQIALRQQQQLERQKAQEEQAKQQLAQQEQQRQRLADQRRAYERQQTIDALLFWLLMASPLLFVALLWQVKWQPAVTAADSVGSWIERRAAKASERTG